MTTKSRSDLEFCVVYSMRFEEMISTLLRRCDRFSSFTVIVLGVAVVANLSPTLTGILVTCFAAYQLVYQPGVEAVKAMASKDRWQELYRQLSNLSDDEIDKRISEIEQHDSPSIGYLKLVAHRAAAIQLGRDVDALPSLTCPQKVVAFFAGA